MYKYLLILLFIKIVTGHEKWLAGNEAKLSCTYISKVPPNDICEYYQTDENCKIYQGYFDYGYFVFCLIVNTPSYFQIAVSFLLLLVLFYFYCILVISFSRLAPNILTVSKQLKLSEHNASITLLLTNSICDILATLYNIEAGTDTEPIITEILSNALLLRTVLMGLVATIYGSTFYKSFIIRDEIFLFFAWFILIIFYNTEDGDVGLHCGILLIIWCLSYFIFIIVQDFRVQKQIVQLNLEKLKKWKMDLGSELIMKPDISANTRKDVAEHKAMWATVKAVDFSDNQILTIKWKRTMLQTFFESLDPRRKNESKISKDWEILLIKISMPLFTLVALFIPVVNSRLSNKSWDKLLICVNVLLLPTFLLFYFPIQYWTYFKVQVIIVFVIVIYLLIVVVTTTSGTSPKYVYLFAFHGVAVCGIMIYFLEYEISALISIFGFISSSGNNVVAVFLGCTQGINEIMITLILAGCGFRRMAYGFASSNSMLNLYMFWGLIIIRKCYVEGAIYVKIRCGVFGQTTFIFVALNLVFSIFGITTTNYKMRKSLGYYALITYFMYTIYIILINYEVIHSFGTDHFDVETMESSADDWA